MKVLRPESDFARRIEKVFRCMEENNIRIDYAGGEFRFSDTTCESDDRFQNMALIDLECRPIETLPAVFEYQLSVFNS